eukprot:gene8632-7869_t
MPSVPVLSPLLPLGFRLFLTSVSLIAPLRVLSILLTHYVVVSPSSPTLHVWYTSICPPCNLTHLALLLEQLCVTILDSPTIGGAPLPS